MHRTMNHGTFAGRFGFLAGAVALAAGIAGTPAWAQSDGPGNDYCVIHKFKITTQGNAAPLVLFGYYAKAYARTNTCKADPAAVKGVVAVGAGVTSKSTSALAPDSTADAEAKINVTTLVAGKVAGEIEANGNADPRLTGCEPPPPNRSSGWGRASSAAKVTVRGQKIDKKGQLVATGGFIAGGEVGGNTERGITRDPIVARLIDNTTGITEEWTLMSFKISNSGGEVGWDGSTLWSTSDYMSFDLRIDSPVTVQQGRLKLTVEAGIVTELIQLGLFSTMPVPTVGTPGAFSVPLGEITLDYDLGGNELNDLVPEIDIDNGGEVEKEIHAMDSGGTIVTDLGTGHDGTNVSEIPTGDTVNGYNLSASVYRLAEDLVVPPGPAVQLDALRWPVYQVNAPAELPSVHAAFVRIWQGMPGFGIPIAGDMVTNRLIDSDFTNLHRVSAQNPASPARPVRDLFIDLSWTPPLGPGQYWIEVGAEGMQNFGSVFSPPTVWHSNQDNAMQFNAQTGQWQPVFDPVSQRRASFPYRIFSGSGQPTQCYADCNGDGALTVADFGCFQTKFVQGDPYADCNGDGQRTVSDFGCFQTRFVQGCP